jgi:hypothetical protein
VSADDVDWLESPSSTGAHDETNAATINSACERAFRGDMPGGKRKGDAIVAIAVGGEKSLPAQ